MPTGSNIFHIAPLAALLATLALGPSCGSQSTNSGGPGGSSSGSSSDDDGSTNGGSSSGGNSSGGNSSSGSPSTSSGGGSGSGGTQSSSSGSGSGSSGSHSSGSGSGSGSSSGTTASGGKTPPDLPTASTTCPTLANGMMSITLGGTAMPWYIWMGSKAATATGPIVIYWHATGTTYSEAQEALGDGITTITGLGGIVASAVSTSNTGTDDTDDVWFTGDLNYADFIIACAIQQLNIDTTHIHAAGYSAGALQTGYMWYARSGYLASTIVYSGGPGFPPAMQDPSNAPSLIGAHGSPGDGGCTNLLSTTCDELAISTTDFESAAEAAGAPIVIDCNDEGDHVDYMRLTNLAPVAWQFFKDHPFGQGKPDPYANGLPSGFPSYCTIYK
jgi:hypothetical protein